MSYRKKTTTVNEIVDQRHDVLHNIRDFNEQINSNSFIFLKAHNDENRLLKINTMPLRKIIGAIKLWYNDPINTQDRHLLLPRLFSTYTNMLENIHFDVLTDLKETPKKSGVSIEVISGVKMITFKEKEASYVEIISYMMSFVSLGYILLTGITLLKFHSQFHLHHLLQNNSPDLILTSPNTWSFGGITEWFIKSETTQIADRLQTGFLERIFIPEYIEVFKLYTAHVYSPAKRKTVATLIRSLPPLMQMGAKGLSIDLSMIDFSTHANQLATWYESFTTTHTSSLGYFDRIWWEPRFILFLLLPISLGINKKFLTTTTKYDALRDMLDLKKNSYPVIKKAILLYLSGPESISNSETVKEAAKHLLQLTNYPHSDRRFNATTLFAECNRKLCKPYIFELYRRIRNGSVTKEQFHRINQKYWYSGTKRSTFDLIKSKKDQKQWDTTTEDQDVMQFVDDLVALELPTYKE